MAALHVHSVRDLGAWKFALWAEALVDLARFEADAAAA